MIQICGKNIVVEGTLVRIAHLDGEGYQFLDDPEVAIAAARSIKGRIDLFTFIQKVSDTTPRYAYPLEWDNMAVLPISTFDHWMTKQIDFKVRNKVRKAVKAGVVVREVPFDDGLVSGISDIYNESSVRQGKAFWHYGKDFETVRSMNATFMSRSVFIGAFLGEILIGFVKLVFNEDSTQAGLMQIISMIQHRDKAPTNALIAQAVRSCADRGIPNLWYANFLYGKKQADSLADFKRHNGFSKVDIPRYYVPLTASGELAYRFGFHRNAREWVPEPIAACYRWTRMVWCTRMSPGTKSV